MNFKDFKYKKQIAVIASLLLVVGGILFFVLNMSSLELASTHQSVEINTEVDFKTYIKEVKNGSIEDVTIDSSSVNTKALGEYVVYYTYKDKTQELSLSVVDTIAPVVEVKSLSILQGKTVSVEDLITNISDATKTTSVFEKEYDFSVEGKHEVNIVVEDEGKNKTVTKTTVEVLVDKKAPEISASDFRLTLNSKADLKNYASVKDDYDSDPTLTVDKGSFDSSKEGTYEITYTATDDFGNKSTKKVNVTVYKPAPSSSNGKKIVYLTFDDGPSAVTATILDTLKQYNVKATFFVTGVNGSSGIAGKYGYLTKRAYQEGHTIALHSYTHDYAIYKSETTYFNDLTKLSNAVYKLIGIHPKYVRFPGGSNNGMWDNYKDGTLKNMQQLCRALKSKGYEYYDWNVSSGDASGSKVSVSKIVNSSIGYSYDNINLLMHDLAGKTTTAQALPQIIEHYLSRGYEFRAIDDNAFAPHYTKI